MHAVVDLKHQHDRIKPESARPGTNAVHVLNAGIFSDPTGYFLVPCTGGNKLLEVFSLDTCEAEEGAVQRTIVTIGTGRACKFGPAFVDHPGNNGTVDP